MLVGSEFADKTDVLNRCPSSDSLSQTVNILKYIFPRQFGLHNVFTSVTDNRQTVQPFKDYTMREDEIAQARRDGDSESQCLKIPKRLRGKAVDLVQKLQNRNRRCSYVELLRYYCPCEVRLAVFAHAVLINHLILIL